MKDKVIEELHRIRERHYEETKGLSFDELAERINQGAEEFVALLEQAKKESKGIMEVSQPV